MGSDAIHLTFWTHACIFESTGNYRIDIRNRRHWALWMDTAGPLDTQYLEVRYMLENKPGFQDMSWFVAGSLYRC
jgi:hypothetical protein